MTETSLRPLVFSLAVLLCACPADEPGTTTSETSGDGDGDPAGDGDGDTGDGDGDTGDGDGDTGDGDGDGNTGDGDGDTGDADEDLWLFFERKSLSDASVAYMTVNITDLDLAGETEVHLSGQTADVGWLGGTPFGSKIMREGAIDMPVVKLLNLDAEGNFELVPIVPEGLPAYAPSPSWTADASAAMVRTSVDLSSSGELHWVTYADKTPVDSTPISGDHGPTPQFAGSTLAEDDSGLLYVVDDDDDDVFEFYYAPIDGAPGPLTQIAQLSAVSQLGPQLDAAKLYYRYDADLDGLRDLWVRDINDSMAPPVQINTVLAGDTLRTRFSDDLQTLLYWTGDGQWGELYVVRFDGATPSAPVRVDSPERPAWTKDFDFDLDGRIIYTFGDAEQGRRGVARLELADGQPGPAQVVTGELAANEELELALYSQGVLIYQLSDADTQTHSLNYVDLSGPVASEPLRFVDAIPDFLIAINFPSEEGRVVFVADMGNGRQVMAVDLDNPDSLVNLSAGLPAGWSVPISASVSPDDRQVVFLARSDNGDDEVAYRVRTDGSGTLEALSEPGYELRLASFMRP